MGTPLAYEEWEITHGGHVVRLRPSLRAAARLERLYDGFAGLERRLNEFDIGAIFEVIRHAATDHQAAHALVMAMEKLSLATVAEIALAPVCGLVRALVPTVELDTEPSTNPGKPMSWPALYSQLFTYGTGWFGWTPETTWNATPNEIMKAIEGHVEKAKQASAAFEASANAKPTGKSTSRKPPDIYSDKQMREIEELGHDPAFNRDALRRLQGRGNVRGDA